MSDFTRFTLVDTGKKFLLRDSLIQAITEDTEEDFRHVWLDLDKGVSYKVTETITFLFGVLT